MRTGSHRLGKWLKQLTIAQHKHAESVVLHGPWAGLGTLEAFGNGIETLGQQSSTSLMLLIALASPKHAIEFLRSVAPSVRLGARHRSREQYQGRASLSIHTTMALYSSGPLLTEAREYVRQLTEAGQGCLRSELAHVLPGGESPGSCLESDVGERAEQRSTSTMQKLPQACRERLEAQMAQPPEALSSMGAVFTAGSAAAARDVLNALAADSRIDKTEIYHLPGAEDRENGSEKFTPPRIRWLFDEVVDSDWIPEWFDLNATEMVEGVRVESARYLGLSIGPWMDRMLAGIGRRYKRMGRDAILAAMQRAKRSKSAVSSFTKEAHRAVIRAYEEHLISTAKVLSPGTFQYESRFKIVSMVFLSHSPCSGQWKMSNGQWTCQTEKFLTGRLLIMFWIAVNLKPEAVRYVMASHMDLIEAFPVNLQTLTITLRDLWADAPANGTREAVEASIASSAKKDTCSCPPSALCNLGHRPSCFVKCTICRAQPMSYHKETSRETSKEGIVVADQFRESAASLACFLADETQMTALQHALDEGGELAVARAVASRTIEVDGRQVLRSALVLPSIPPGLPPLLPLIGLQVLLGIKHVLLVRGFMIARGVFHTHARRKMQLTKQTEMSLPGDADTAPDVANVPSQRLLAFVEGCAH